MSKFKIFGLFAILVVSYCLMIIGGHAVLAQTTSAGPNLGTEYGELTGLKNIDPRVVAARLINVVLGVLGIVAVAIVLMGGFLWMTAGGGEEKVGKAKKLLTAGIIGLVIVLCAYIIASFVIRELVQATTLS